MKKVRQVYDTYPGAMKEAVEAGITLVFGSDILSLPRETIEYDDNATLEFNYLTEYMSNAEALKMATGNAGQLIQETDPNNPYPFGPTGVIKVGAIPQRFVPERSEFIGVGIRIAYAIVTVTRYVVFSENRPVTYLCKTLDISV